MTETSLEQAVDHLAEKESKRHLDAWKAIAARYNRAMEDERRHHALRLEEIRRIADGLPVRGFCQSCMRYFRGFHQWDDYEQCPRCGAELPGGSER